MNDSLISGDSPQDQNSEAVNDADVSHETPQRPDWLPEKFWVDNQPAYESLAKSYGELETRFRSKDESLRESIIEELSAEAIADRPAKVEDYELPEIESVDLQQLANHPLTEWWANFAYENGFGQDTFKEGIQKYLEARMTDVPDYEREMEAIGDNASARTQAVGLWASKNLGQDEMAALEQVCTTAANFKLVEKLIAMAGNQGNPDAVTESVPEVDEADVRKMMMDRRYWSAQDRDPRFVKQVERFFQKKYSV